MRSERVGSSLLGNLAMATLGCLGLLSFRIAQPSSLHGSRPHSFLLAAWTLQLSLRNAGTHHAYLLGSGNCTVVDVAGCLEVERRRRRPSLEYAYSQLDAECTPDTTSSKNPYSPRLAIASPDDKTGKQTKSAFRSCHRHWRWPVLDCTDCSSSSYLACILRPALNMHILSLIHI